MELLYVGIWFMVSAVSGSIFLMEKHRLNRIDWFYFLMFTWAVFMAGNHFGIWRLLR